VLAADDSLVSFQWFVVILGFSDEDQLLMENMYAFKVYGEKKLIKKFMNKGWRLRGLNKLLKKLQETGTTARRRGRIESIQNSSCFSTV